MEQARRYLFAGLKGLVIAALLVWSLTPIIWNILTSFKVPGQIFDYPPVFFFMPNLDAYRQALGPGGIYPQLQNSLFVAIGTTVVSLACAVLAGYAFSRYEFPGRTPLMLGLVATRLLPPISAVVPLYLLASDLNLVDTRTILVVIYSALNIPFATWLLKSYVDAVPKELEESAFLEGCGSLRTIQKDRKSVV